MQSVSLSLVHSTPTPPAAAAAAAAAAAHDVHIGARTLPAGWKDAALFTGLAVSWILLWTIAVIGGSELLFEFPQYLASFTSGPAAAPSPVWENVFEATRFAGDAHSEYAAIILLLVFGHWVAWWSRGVTFVEVSAGGMRLTRRVGRTAVLRWDEVQHIKRRAFAANSASVLRNYRIAGAGRNWRYAPADALAFEAALQRLRPPAAPAVVPAWLRRIAGWARTILGKTLLLLCLCVAFALLLAAIKFVAEPVDSGSSYLSVPLQRAFLFKPGAPLAAQPALLVNGVKAGNRTLVREAIGRIGNLREVAFKEPLLEVAIWGRKAIVRGHSSPLQTAPAYTADEQQRRVEIIRVLVAHGAHVDPGALLAAALSENRQLFSALLAAGAPLDDSGVGGMPEVAIAARESLAALTWYLDAKANPNQPDDAGNTPLMIVARSSQAYAHKRTAMGLLVARGARLDAQAADGRTLAHALAAGGDAKLFNEWVERGGGYNARARNGETLMHVAARRDHTQVLQQLINRGSSVHVTDSDGATPLHGARAAAVVSFLVAQGAAVDAPDSLGRTPLHTAVILRQWDAVPALLKSGARRDARDNTDVGGRTPLDYFNDPLAGSAKPPANSNQLLKLLTP